MTLLIRLMALLTIGLAAITPLCAEPGASGVVPASRGHLLLLAVRVNGMTSPRDEYVLQLDYGRLALSADTLQRWRLRLPSVEPVAGLDTPYYPLDGAAGWHYVLDPADQELQLEIPASSFLPSTVNAGVTPQGDVRVSPGAFVNYDLLLQRTRGMTDHFGFVEAGAFNRSGVATSSFLWQDSGAERRLVRIDTGWTRDEPAQLSRLQVGDNITRAGSWGLPVRFGGVQWRTNFDTQPGFITFPQPGVAGVATLPSTIDVYVNNARQFSQSVPPGPFEISNVPVITGSGEVQLVVRDMLGRQQLVTQPYYASPSLLRAGLSDYAYELGFIREDYGLRSNHYGRPFARALRRHGASDTFTHEMHAELLSSRQMLGLGGAFLSPGIGTVQGAVMASHGPDGNGARAMAGVEHIARRYSLSAQIQSSSVHYAQLGWPTETPRPRRAYSLRLGISPGMLAGSLSVARVRQQYWGREGTAILSVNYSRSLSRDTFLTLYAMQSGSGPDASRAVGLAISHVLGAQTSVNAQISHQGTQDNATVQLQRNVPPGPGFGYRLLAGHDLASRQEASGVWQGDAGTLSAGASSQDGNTSVKLGASGGMAFLGGAGFFSRRIEDSFAVVDTAGLPHVRVLHENRVAGRTDERGLALIPYLHAYHPNRISIEQADLPIEAEADELDMRVVPAARSGIHARFPIRIVNGGRLVLVLEDGSFLPAGATVRVEGQLGEFTAGERGEVFLPVLAATNDLVVSWGNRTCTTRLSLPSGRRALDPLGVRLCRTWR